MNSLTTFFKQNANIYQFIYSTLFPKHFCRIDNDAIQSRFIFETVFVNFKAQKNGFNSNIKSGNVINTAIKIESEEKEEEQQNYEKSNQKIKKRNQRNKKNLWKILMETLEEWQK